MSKSQAPAPAGQTPHVPKIRIRGVQTGSDAYNALVDRFRGELNTFQGKHQQTVAISGNPQYAAKRRVDGATLWYHNNNGQETVTMIVDEVPAGEEQPTSPEAHYWDWALIEFTIPGLGKKTSADMSAFLPHPIKDQIVYGRYDGASSEDNILRYGAAASDKQIGDVNSPDDIVLSLLVDLHKFQNDGGVTLDLYGYLLPFDNFGLPTDTSWPYTITASTRLAHWGRDASPYSAPYTVAQVSRDYGTIDVMSTFSEDYDALIASFPELAGRPYGFEIASVNDGMWQLAPFWDDTLDDGGIHAGQWWDPNWLDPSDSDPNSFTSNFAATYSHTFTYWDDANLYRKTETKKGVTGHAPDGSTWTSNVITQTNDNGAGSHTAWDLEMFDYVDYFVPTCYVTPTLDARINVTFFKGDGPDATSYWFDSSGTNFNQYLWEVAKLYPARTKMHELPDTALFTGMDEPTVQNVGNHFGAPQLGTLHINPNMSTGGFKFKRA